jgi:hypothetical protein
MIRSFPAMGRSASVSNFWWALVWLTLFIPLLCLWGFAVWDILSARHDLSGWAKALWVFGLLVLPLIGAMVYVIARPKDERFGGYAYADPYGYGAPYSYRPEYERASGPRPAVDDLETIDRLHDTGTLSDDEYSALKGRMTEQQRPAA